MSEIKLNSITKTFDQTIAVEDLNLLVKEGRLFTLVGPSGCGKTTTLRIIGGFEEPDQGEVYLGGRAVTDVAASNRDTAMVFQNYAIWPHKSVFENVSYGLKIKRISKQQIRKQVEESLEMVGLLGQKDRSPGQLSGGQQQRVALARSLVVEPSVLLMDEPLGNLDAKLRKEMRLEIRGIQQDLDITMLWVTHNQREALGLSDQLAVMREGKFEQIGTPYEVYSSPTNRFVAEFLCSANIFRCEVVEVDQRNDEVKLETKEGVTLVSTEKELNQVGGEEGRKVYVAIDPQAARIGTGGGKELKAEVGSTMFLGSLVKYQVGLTQGEKMVIHTPLSAAKKIYSAGEKIVLGIDKHSVKIVEDIPKS